MAEGDRITTTENFGRETTSQQRSTGSSTSRSRASATESPESPTVPVDLTAMYDHTAALRTQLSKLPNSEPLAAIYAELAAIDVQLAHIVVLLADLEAAKDALVEETSA